MRVQLNLPFLPYEEIGRKAEEFLSMYAARTGPPVQIEEIVDLDMGIDIIPMSELRDQLETDGFMASDFTCIYVDESVFSHRVEHRYRFTLAHEVGHIVLHKDILRRFSFSDLEEYAAFIDGIDEDDLSRLEHQAYCFAGLVLVPADHLQRAFDETLSARRLQNTIHVAREQGLSRDAYFGQVRALISERIARRFLVSTQVVERRLEYSGLEQRIP